MKKTNYLAFNLTDESRGELLSRFKPSFPVVDAEHVTHHYDVADDAALPEVTSIRVIGFAKNEHIECAVVEVNGEKFRAFDGKRYHITISHDEDTKPYMSNILLLEQEYEPCDAFDLAVVASMNAV